MSLFDNETKKRKGLPPEATEKKEANTGIWVSGGEIEQSDYDSLSLSEKCQDITNMRNGDAIASTSLDILLNPILTSTREILPGAKKDEKPTANAIEAAEYINWVYDHLYPSYYDYVYHKCLAYPYGFIIFEKVWERAADYEGKMTNRVSRLVPIQYDTIRKFYYDTEVNFIGIEHEKRIPEKAFQIVDIMIDKLFVFTPFPEFGNITGRSMLRPIRELFDVKSKVWRATGRAAVRGAGIPVGTITDTGNPTEFANAKSQMLTTLRTIGNSEKAYVLESQNMEGIALTKIRFEQLANQQDNMNIIDQANKEMLYNTLTQFLAAGIGNGANGSRSATSEHKSPYERSLYNMINCMENNDNQLIKEIIDNSYLYGKLSLEEYPTMKYKLMREDDLSEAARNLVALANARIVNWTEEDEKFAREIFGLHAYSVDELKVISEEKRAMIQEDMNSEKEIKNDETDKESDPLNKEDRKEKDEEKEKLNAGHSCHELGSMPITDKSGMSFAERNIFEMQSAVDTFEDTETKASGVVIDVYRKLVNDLADQLEKNNGEKFTMRYKAEMQNRLNSIYKEAYTNGYKDVTKELNKIRPMFGLAALPIVAIGSKSKLAVKVDNFYDAMEAAFKNLAMRYPGQSALANGGWKKIVGKEFNEAYKGLQTSLVKETAGGYTSGRGDKFIEAKEESGMELQAEYTTALDEDVCAQCMPYHSLTASISDWEARGIVLGGSPLNPACEGRDYCRCQLIGLEYR